jgi:3-phytase
MRRFAVAVLASGLLGCSQPSPEPPAPATTPEPDVDVKTVAETFETPRLPDDDVDSVAFWKGDAGEWLIATAKATHVLHVYDAATGEHLRRVGGEGGEIGQFRRPNGIAVAGDLALVVERDNRRVQFLRLPDFEPVGTAGGDVLRRPYGLAVLPGADGVHDLFVTDNDETPDEQIPPPAELGERVKRFRWRLAGSTSSTAGPSSTLARSPAS